MQKEMTMPDGSKVTATKFSDGAKANVAKQEEALAKAAAEARQERIGKAAHKFNQYHKAYAKDHNLSEEELIAAIFLENLNCREYYPKELGGKESFDEITSQVHEWFEANKE